MKLQYIAFQLQYHCEITFHTQPTAKFGNTLYFSRDTESSSCLLDRALGSAQKNRTYFPHSDVDPKDLIIIDHAFLKHLATHWRGCVLSDQKDTNPDRFYWTVLYLYNILRVEKEWQGRSNGSQEVRLNDQTWLRTLGLG